MSAITRYAESMPLVTAADTLTRLALVASSELSETLCQEFRLERDADSGVRDKPARKSLIDLACEFSLQ